MKKTITIEVDVLIPGGEEKIRSALQQLANNLDNSALQIIAEKSAKKGMSDKIRAYKHLL